MRSIILLLIVLFTVGSLFASADQSYEGSYGEQEVVEIVTPAAPALNGYIYIVSEGCSCGCSC